MKILLAPLFYSGCTILLFLFSSSLFAQQNNLPLNREYMLNIDRAMDHIFKPVKNDSVEPPTVTCDPYASTYCTSFRPLIESNSFSFEEINGKKGLNRDMNFGVRNLLMSEDVGFWFATKKTFYENLIVINDTADKFHMTIDPLFNFEFGKDTQDSTDQRVYTNTRGAMVRGDIGHRFSFETAFYENQGSFVPYLDTFNRDFRVIPGQGRWKSFKADPLKPYNVKYDYAMASGHVSYSPCSHLNFQLGHGKHFIGDGYRSLLLSDNSFNYPFFRMTTTFKNIQYTNLYTVFMNLAFGPTPVGTERLFQKKAGSFQFLSVNLGKRLQLGLFEGMIWEAADTKNNQNVDISYLNPLIFGSAVQYKLNGLHNVVLGSTIKIKISSDLQLYGQYLLDDMASGNVIPNKNGFQAGFKYFDVCKVKHLSLQLEYNQVRPYAYATKLVRQNYSHYNQPLAHPLGANFIEGLTIIDYHFRGFFTQFKFTYAVTGKDSSGTNFGSDIFSSTNSAFNGEASDNNTLGQGLKTTITHADFYVGYLFNPATNFNVVVGVSDRTYRNDLTSFPSHYVYIGIRTSLTNHYYDF